MWCVAANLFIICNWFLHFPPIFSTDSEQVARKPYLKTWLAANEFVLWLLLSDYSDRMIFTSSWTNNIKTKDMQGKCYSCTLWKRQHCRWLVLLKGSGHFKPLPCPRHFRQYDIIRTKTGGVRLRPNAWLLNKSCVARVVNHVNYEKEEDTYKDTKLLLKETAETAEAFLELLHVML